MLLEEEGCMKSLIYNENNKWSETNYLAISCLKALVTNLEGSEGTITTEYKRFIKDSVLNILCSMSYNKQDNIFYNKVNLVFLFFPKTLIRSEFQYFAIQQKSKKTIIKVVLSLR